MNIQNPEAADPSSGAFGRHLETWVTGFAIGGGVLLVALTIFTVISVIGRAVFSSPILGDTEVTELASGLAVFAFLPYCQFKGGNIVVDLFTMRMAPKPKAVLDAVNNIVFTGVIAILCWRLFFGGIDAWNHNEISMLLRMPLWIGYTGAVISTALLTLVCVNTVILKFKALDR